MALLNGSSGYGGNGGGKHNNINSNTHASQHACSSICDEVVVLWHLAALNPGLSPQERDILHNQFSTWHCKIVEKVTKCRNSNLQNISNKNSTLKIDLEVFTGFKPAIDACYLDWEDYPMPGITYTEDTNPMYHCPFTCFRHSGDGKVEPVTQINSSKAVLNLHPHPYFHFFDKHSNPNRHYYNNIPDILLYDTDLHFNHPHAQLSRDGNRSSVSSEGFCENDDDINVLRVTNRALHSLDSDSQEGGGSDSGSSTSSSESCNRDIVESTQRSSNSEDSDNKKNYVESKNPSCLMLRKKSDVLNDGDLLRRISKDESTSSSNSGDEYSIYYYNAKDVGNEVTKESKDIESKANMFVNLKKTDDPWDVLFARAEGLHAHGHSREACMLAVKLAEQLLANPPNLMRDIPPVPKRKGRKQPVNPASHQLSCLASSTLSKCAFLCSVLAENSERFHLAFRVGMFGLEMARPPASTKPLEVKLAVQESDLASLLKKIPLGFAELQILRERAQQLKDGTLKSRGEAVLPIMLANFVFDALVVPSYVSRDRRVQPPRMPSDEPLAFEAAVAALGLKANVSEADHPLLCEGTRRQRGDLAITMLVFYRHDCWKISRIMDKLLDRDVHQLTKVPIPSPYYSGHPPVRSHFTSLKRDDPEKIVPPLNSFVSPAEVLTEPGMYSLRGILYMHFGEVCNVGLLSQDNRL